MKETLKIAKTFVCRCGTTNKFEFETDFVLGDIKINAKCQACGAEQKLSLNDFVKLQPLTLETTEGVAEDTFEEETAYADLFGRV